MAGKVERFEDLKCWQKARELVNAVFKLCKNKELATDFVTQRQLKGAAIGTMNNIAEGFGRISNKDFIKFLDYSSSSSMEVRSMLYILSDQNYITQEDFEKTYNLSIDHTNLTLGLIRYLTNKNKD